LRRGLSALASGPSVLRPFLACSRLPVACPLSRATAPPHGFADAVSPRALCHLFRVAPLQPFPPLGLHSNRAFARRNSRNQAQDVRAFSGRVLRACRARTSLGCSALQGLTVRTLDWISPVAPLTFLPSPRRLGWNLRVSIGLHCGAVGVRFRILATASPSWASYPRTLTCCFGSGPRRAHVFTFERGARCRLAIRSTLPGPHFLLEHSCLSASG